MRDERTRPYAVIDIGSNSVRLVVYSRPLRAMLPMFNEKILCGLGKDLAVTGRLRPEGIEQALAALGRFGALAEKMRVSGLRAVGTAALRDAEDGQEFVATARERYGIDIEIVSGREEARLSASGVAAGLPEAKGLVGDLGGGSLELVILEAGKAIKSHTLPLGPQRLGAAMREGRLEQVVDDHLSSVPWLSEIRGKTFYAVGGAFRTVARVHMGQSHYPLPIIHRYALGLGEAMEIAEVLARQSTISLSRLRGVSPVRVDTLPTAALVFSRLLAISRPKRIEFSSHGLREGLLFNEMTDTERRLDPLETAYRDMEKREGRFPGFGADLSIWTAPLFEDESGLQARLRRAACHVSDVGWLVHSDFREGQAFRRILRAPFAAIDHPGRAFIALAVYTRYGGDVESSAVYSARTIINAEEVKRARILGAAMRLGYAIAGGAPGLLVDSRLKLSKDRVVLKLSSAARNLGGGDSLQRRLASLGKVMARSVEIARG